MKRMDELKKMDAAQLDDELIVMVHKIQSMMSKDEKVDSNVTLEVMGQILYTVRVAKLAGAKGVLEYAQKQAEGKNVC